MTNNKKLNKVMNEIINELQKEEPKYNDNGQRIYLSPLSLAIYILKKQSYHIVA